MKVKELIEKLKEQNQELEVIVVTNDGYEDIVQIIPTISSTLNEVLYLVTE